MDVASIAASTQTIKTDRGAALGCEHEHLQMLFKNKNAWFSCTSHHYERISKVRANGGRPSTHG
jgi:hypothetical protein